MKKIIFFILLILSIGLVGCSKSSNNESITNDKSTLENSDEPKTTVSQVDYSESFNGINGCAVFYNPSQNKYELYNSELCEDQIPPYSTFKIVTTLMGLSQGIVESPLSTLGYDGTIYSRDEWNKDVTLEEAFKTSCVWYYKKIMSKLDKDYVQQILNDLDFGNCDISAWDENGHNGFWLSSSLKISPLEQVEVLHKIFDGKTNFNKNNIELLKQFMLVEENENYSVYGKTGSASKQNAWFVGFFEKGEEKTYFATRINDASQTLAGSVAKEITLNIITNFYKN